MVRGTPMGDWLGLAIGNSRLHWAWFQGAQIRATWDTSHHDAVVAAQFMQTGFQGLTDALTLPASPPQWCQDHASAVPLYIASVVPAQTQIWQQYPLAQVLDLADVPIGNVYPTLGLDRALALWGAIQRYGAPVLVIDGGTAMTLTGADADKKLIGGAILPGLRTLFQALNRSTAALPEVWQHDKLPDRWATETEAAIRSGILHTVIAGLWEFMQDWWESYPDRPIVFTGGDGQTLQRWLAQRSAQTPIHSSRAAQILSDPQLIFVGMSAVVQPDYPIADRN